MQLLVSVASAAEAAAALAGGADVIDAKNPAIGALGPVSLRALRGIRAAIAGKRAMTAAVGDAIDETMIARTACAFVSGGAALVKIGFVGLADRARVASLITAAVEGVRASGAAGGVVAVAYADASVGSGVPPLELAALAASSGASGVLLDTCDKQGPRLPELVSLATLTSFVSDARGRGLTVALAGRLTAEDLPLIRETGADIAGVRGAACEGGRAGRVSRERVRMLRGRCG